MRIYGWTILFGCVLAAPAAWGQGNTTTTSTSTAEIDTYNTTNVTQQVNAFQVELKARMQGGAYLFDQTYGAALASTTVQSAIAQAMSLLTNAGAKSFTGPTLLSSNQSTSSATSTVQTGTQYTVLIGTGTWIGPVTTSFGDHGICQSYAPAPVSTTGSGLTGASPDYFQLTGCASGTLFNVVPGGEDIDTLIVSLGTISQTVTTTNTTLTSQVYEIDGLTSSFSPCDINQDGYTNVADVQDIINEALGVAPAVNDLTGDSVVNVADVQIVINAALGLGCAARVGSAALAAAPAIHAVVNAASFRSGPIAGGEVVSLLGTGLGRGEVQVLFDGRPAPVTYVSPTEIKCVVPYEVSNAGRSQIQVRYQDRVSDPFAVTTVAANPAIFSADGSGSGPAAALNQDQSPNSPANPAARGSTVVVFLTGVGQTSPPGETGKVTSISGRPPQPLLPVAVFIGGQPASVISYGEAPGVISGVMQLSVRIPWNVPPGGVPVSVSAGGNGCPNAVTISVK